MRITAEQLKRIIKEELDDLQENEMEVTNKDIQAGKELVGSPIGDVIFKALDQDPKVQKALQSIQSQMNEEDVGGQFGAMGGAIGGASVATKGNVALWSGLITKSLGPAALGTLKALGIWGGGITVGALVGYLIYKGLMGKP